MVVSQEVLALDPAEGRRSTDLFEVIFALANPEASPCSASGYHANLSMQCIRWNRRQA